MNLRSLWAYTIAEKPYSDALEYITKRVNLVFNKQHTPDGAHTAITATSLVAALVDATTAEVGALYTRELTPAVLTASVNDWNPPGIASFTQVVVESTAAVNISGILAPRRADGSLWFGRRLRLIGDTAFTITVLHESGLSVAVNRVFFGDGANFAINLGDVVDLSYSQVGTGRWVGIHS